MPSIPDNAPIPSYGSTPETGAPPARKIDAKAPDLGQRLKAVEGKLVDALEGMIDRLSAPPRAHLPLVTQRRQIANTLRAWRYCPVMKCQRAQCCRSEPTHCLHIVLPLMPEALADLAKPRRRKRRA